MPEGMQSGWLALAGGAGEGRVLEKSESIRALGAFSRPTENDVFSANVNRSVPKQGKYFTFACVSPYAISTYVSKIV